MRFHDFKEQFDGIGINKEFISTQTKNVINTITIEILGEHACV